MARPLIIALVLVLLVAGAAGAWYLRKARVEGLIQEQYRLAEAAKAQGDWVTAGNHLGRYLQRRPTDNHAWLELAEIQLKVRPVSGGTLRAAAEGYKRALRAVGGDPELQKKVTPQFLRNELARLYRALGDGSELGFVAEQQLAESPGDAAATVWKAESLLRRNANDEARRLLTQLVERPVTPEAQRAYVEACVLLAGLDFAGGTPEQYPAARAWLDKALQVETDAGPARVALLDLIWQAALASRGPAQQALADELQNELRKLVERPDGAPIARLRVAELLMNLGQHERAAQILEQLQSVDESRIAETFADPDDWHVAYFLARARWVLETENATAAGALADQMLAAASKPGHQLRLLPSAARLKLAAAEVPAARKLVERFAAERGTSKDSEDELRVLDAEVKLRELKPFEAIGVLEPLLAADPSASARWARPLREALAEAYLMTGQADRALPLLVEMARRQSSELAAQKRLIRELLGQGLEEVALQLAIETERRLTTDTELLELRIRAQLAVARRDSARVDPDELEQVGQDIERLITSDPQRAGGYVLRSLLASLRGDPQAAAAALQSASSATGQDAALRLELARVHIRADDFRAAEEACRGVTAEFPADPRGWALLSKVVLANERPDEAEQLLRSGIEQVPAGEARYGLQRQLAELMLSRERPAEAQALLEQLATANPADLSVRDALLRCPPVFADAARSGQLIDELKRIEGSSGLVWRLHQARRVLAQPEWRAQEAQARELLEFCVAARPRWVEPGVMLAQLYERLERLADAETTYRRYVDAPGMTAAVVGRLKEVMLRQGHYDELVKLLAQLRARFTADELAPLGVALDFASGDLDAAIGRIRSAAEADADRLAEEFATFAYLDFLERRRTNDTLAALARAAEVRPNSAPLLTTRLLVLRTADRVDDAVALADAYVAAHADQAAAYELRAGFLESIGRRDAAQRDLAQVAELAGLERGAALSAEFHWRAGEREAAVDVLNKALASQPASGALKRLLARALLARQSAGDRADAARLVSELEASADGAGGLELLKAALLLTDEQADNDPAARPLLDAAIAAEPGDAEAYIQLATLHARLGDLPAARDVLMRAERAAAGDPRLLLARATVDAGLRDDAAAKIAVREILEREPENRAAVQLLTDLVLRSGDVALLQRFSPNVAKLAAAAPDLERVRIAHTVSLALQDQAAAAVAQYPPDVVLPAAEFLGRPDLGKQPLAAEQLYAALLAAQPESVDGRLGLAGLKLAHSDGVGAIAEYRRVLERQPENLAALNNLAWMLAQYEADQPESLAEALRAIDAALMLEPANANLHDTRGFILARIPERAADARAAFERALELIPADAPERAPVTLRLARLRAARGELAGFEVQIREALQIDRQHKVLSETERAELVRLIGN